MESLRDRLDQALNEALGERTFALLAPASQGWDVCPKYGSTPTQFTEILREVPQAVRWPVGATALGLALCSRWMHIGVIAWSAKVEDDGRLQRALASAVRVFWESCEESWAELSLALLKGLAAQRKEIGTAIHRGPAQSLTAARLELSMSPSGSSLADALEQASEGLVQLVHGKLRGRELGNDLIGALKGELDFQRRWFDLAESDHGLTLPQTCLTPALVQMWRQAGGEVQEHGSEARFVMDLVAP